MSIRGVHTALHTNEALLSAGAWTSTTSTSSPCAADGLRHRTLWLSVFEVVHLGVDPATPVVQPLDLPPLRRMPCCQNPCFRCENRRGGFQFPFIGICTRRAVLSRRGATPAETWQLAQTDHATLDLVAATMHSSSLEVGDFVPAHMERLSRRLSFGMDGISMDYLFNQWRMWRLGSPI